MKIALGMIFLLFPTLAFAQTAGFCQIDCASGYHASPGNGSCPEQCVADSSTQDTSSYYSPTTYTSSPTYSSSPSYGSSSYSSSSYYSGSTYSSPSYGSSSSLVCTNLGGNLRSGSADVGQGGSVTLLQQFLISSGDLSHAATGYYGSLTAQAVVQFQQSQGISPTGTVGPLTRAAISRVSCGSNAQGGNTPSISTLLPSSGQVGTTVTIQGSGFVNDNAVYFDGYPITRATSITGKTVTFIVPASTGASCTDPTNCLNPPTAVTQGQYPVYVQNTNGSSNTTYFTVIPSPQATYKPVIQSVNGPASLYLNQQGTWSVNIAAPNLTQVGYNLNVSVHWGDEQLTPNTSYNASSQNSSPTSVVASFSHAYVLPGSYTLTFTVTDPAGYSASYLSTVYVY